MTNYKPFDLKKALAGEPVITRDGRKVLKIVHIDSNLSDPLYKLCCIIIDDDDDHNDDGPPFIIDAFFTDINGREQGNDTFSPDDLFMAPTTYWINIYKTSDGHLFVHSNICDSKKQAMESMVSHLKYIQTIPFTLDEDK